MRFFNGKTKQSVKACEIVFQENGVIDVTNFNALTPEDSLGYMCGCEIQLYINGQLQINSCDEKRETLESFSILSIIKARNNIKYYDPMFSNTVSIITEEKRFDISFQSIEEKNSFWKSLTTVYDSLKRDSNPDLLRPQE